MPAPFSLRKAALAVCAASGAVLAANLRTRDPASLKLEDELEAVSLVTSSGSNNPASETNLLQEKSQSLRDKSSSTVALNATVNATANATAEPTKAELQHKQIEMEQELEKIVNLVGKIGTPNQAKTANQAASQQAPKPGEASNSQHLAQMGQSRSSSGAEPRDKTPQRLANNYLEGWTVVKSDKKDQYGNDMLVLQKGNSYDEGLDGDNSENSMRIHRTKQSDRLGATTGGSSSSTR